MVTFIGKYGSKMDDKGRLVFPAPFKSLMNLEGDMRFVIKKSIYDDCLEMCTFEEWTKQTDAIRETLDFFNPRHVQFWRQYMRDCDVVEPDPKLGRISISRELLDAIGVDKDVVFFGINYKIEVWAKEKFEASKISNDQFLAIAESLSKKK